MSDQLIYGVVIMVVVAAAVMGAIFAPGQAAIILPLCTLVCVQLLSLLQGSKAAGKVAEVAVTAKASEAKVNHLALVAAHTQQTAQAVHTLVNSATGVQLKSNAILARRLADLTKDPADAQAATESERLYNEHQTKQATVDANPPPPAIVAGQPTPPAEVTTMTVVAEQVVVTQAEPPKETG